MIYDKTKTNTSTNWGSPEQTEGKVKERAQETDTDAEIHSSTHSESF